MPGHNVTKHEELFNFMYKLPKGRFFAKRFVPIIDTPTVHHINLYGCESFKEKCQSKSTVIPFFWWAYGGQEYELISDTAMELGEETDSQYILLSIHYVGQSNKTDYSGVVIYWTDIPTKYNAGIFLLHKFSGVLPAQTKHYPIDLSCKYTGNTILYPFAFLIHTHDLGRSVVGFVISSNQKQVIAIGRANPLWPEQFYSVKSKFVIQPGDFVTVRCVFDSTNRTKDTLIGMNHEDEMCGMYVMYSIERTKVTLKPYDNVICIDNDYPDLFDHLLLPNDTTDYLPEKVPPNYFPSKFLRYP